MVVELKFKNHNTLKARNVKTKIEGLCLYELLADIKHLTSIVNNLQKTDEFLIGINDKD